MLVRRNRALLAAIGITTSVALTACGSSTEPASSGAAGPVTIMMISQITGPGFGSPETVSAAKASVKSANARGGVGGHQIRLLTCNDKGDATTAGNCARTAVENHAIAVIEGITVQGETIDPILEASDIPIIAHPVVPIDYKSTDFYPIDGGGISLYVGEGQLLAQSGCTKIGILTSTDNVAAATGGKQVAAGVEAAEAKVVKNVDVPTNVADLSGAIAELNRAGVDCIGNSLTVTQFVAAMQAIATGSNPSITVGQVGAVFSHDLAKQLGPKAKNVIFTSAAALPGDPAAKPFTSAMEKYGATSLTGFAENIFIATRILQEALKEHHGALSSKDAKTALDSSADLKVPALAAPVQYTRPFDVTEYARITNRSLIAYKFDGVDTFVQIPGDAGTIDATEGIKRYAANN